MEKPQFSQNAELSTTADGGKSRQKYVLLQDLYAVSKVEAAYHLLSADEVKALSTIAYRAGEIFEHSPEEELMCNENGEIDVGSDELDPKCWMKIEDAPTAFLQFASKLQPHQWRVVEERNQLNEKLAKLHIFTDTETFHSLDEAERNRLYRQMMIMQDYVSVLDERIAAF